MEEKLAKAQVADINELIVNSPAIVKEDTPIREMLESIIKDTRSRHAYVVDKNNKLIGSIRINNVIQYLFPSTILKEQQNSPKVGSFMDYLNARVAGDIMSMRPNYVFKDTPLDKMVDIMIDDKSNELPVVNKDMEVIGEVNVLEVIAFALKNSETTN